MKSIIATTATLLFLSTAGLAFAQNNNSNNASEMGDANASNCPEEGAVPVDQLSEKCRAESNAAKASGGTMDNTGSTTAAPPIVDNPENNAADGPSDNKTGENPN